MYGMLVNRVEDDAIIDKTRQPAGFMVYLMF